MDLGAYARAKFTDSINNYYSIVNYANELKENDLQKYKKSFYTQYYEAKSLVALGRFDEAEKVLDEYTFELFKKYKYNKYLIALCNDLKGAIHFYRREYFTYLTKDLPKINTKFTNKNVRKVILPRILEDQGIKYSDDDKKYFKEKIIRHVTKKHKEEFFCNIEDIVEYVMNNMHLLPIYYNNYSQLRVIKINSIGIRNNGICDYVFVISNSDNPYSIRTLYPIKNIGEMSYVDLTEGFKDKIYSASEGKNENNNGTARSKFMLRQSKMNNK
ncbi:MAG: hypothetical protein J5634_02715 [Bacilli bacterium]|nr:hypothetical protein [Bacilli bacterium]